MSARRLLLIGEGDQDVGREGVRREGDFEGDLPRLLRRLVRDAGGDGGFGYRAFTITSLVRSFTGDRPPTRAGGKGKDLRDAVLAGLRTDPGPAAVVAVIDARASEVEKLESDLRTIIDLCREEAPDVPVALGLAVQEIEIWMLSDPEARRAAFATAGLREPPALEDEPDPKARWREYAGQAPAPPASPRALFEDQMRAAAWSSLRPQVVARACPRGFGPLLARLEPVLAVLSPRP